MILNLWPNVWSEGYLVITLLLHCYFSGPPCYFLVIFQGYLVINYLVIFSRLPCYYLVISLLRQRFDADFRVPSIGHLTMATLAKATGETITKGRSLEGDIASHNLCVISETRAITELRQRFDPDRTKNYIAFAIGGKYRDPTDIRGKTQHYDGIQVMGLTKRKYKHPLWCALEWKRLHCLLKGDHTGAVEGRSKCKRKSDNLGIAEFDGQSALTYFNGQFLYTHEQIPKNLDIAQFKYVMVLWMICLHSSFANSQACQKHQIYISCIPMLSPAADGW